MKVGIFAKHKSCEKTNTLTTFRVPKSGINSIKDSGFTIIELLIVVVIIGVLATISVVNYIGISEKAKIVSIKSDLKNAATQIQLFRTTSPTDDFPTANNCPSPGLTEVCLKSSGSNSYSNSYMVNNLSSPKTFSLDAMSGTLRYRITESTVPTAVTSLVDIDPASWMLIGSQIWSKNNINVGTMINGSLSQANNATVEKYCYNDVESNCTTYGGLYQWDEMMQYSTTQGTQGICPSGSHLPSDSEIKTLEMSLGMSQVQADNTSWRGTDQGLQLRSGGASSMNIVLGGTRGTDGSFWNLDTQTRMWSSSESGSNAWARLLTSGMDSIARYADAKISGYLVRCVGN
ncbi:prepilin-type N-terminal cleavage/methylation domain-containing protein [Candidatus Saccharibacteria bacterium]|nr:prepilin-type N-terminal cleavage/methylation domain-containing protein [Candidatus Saccharibacteria bacterium]